MWMKYNIISVNIYFPFTFLLSQTKINYNQYDSKKLRTWNGVKEAAKDFCWPFSSFSNGECGPKGSSKPLHSWYEINGRLVLILDSKKVTKMIDNLWICWKWTLIEYLAWDRSPHDSNNRTRIFLLSLFSSSMSGSLGLIVSKITLLVDSTSNHDPQSWLATRVWINSTLKL